MINVVYDWLEPEVLAAIKQKFEDSKTSAVFEINNMGRWGQGLDAGSYSPVFILALDEYQEYFIKKYQALDSAFEGFNSVTAFMHIWPPGSQIAWHDDQPSDDQPPRIGSTIYINDSWNWNWGGLFLYDDPDTGQGWVFPDPNKMIWFVPPVWHSTSMVGLNAPYPRLSVQLFFEKK